MFFHDYHFNLILKSLTLTLGIGSRSPSEKAVETIFVKKATHAMILVNAKWFNDNLPDLICKN